jgi:hypothetical protein
MAVACGGIHVAVCSAPRQGGIESTRVISAHGHPVPLVRKGSRDELHEATDDTKLPALKLPDGTVPAHPCAVLSWVSQQPTPGALINA